MSQTKVVARIPIYNDEGQIIGYREVVLKSEDD
jgi:hypothetical protein